MIRVPLIVQLSYGLPAWLSADDVAREFKVPRRTAAAALRRGVELGLFERCGDGVRGKPYFYRNRQRHIEMETAPCAREP